MNNIFVSMKRREVNHNKRMMRYCFDKATKALRHNDMVAFTCWNRRALEYGNKYTIANIEFKTMKKGA